MTRALVTGATGFIGAHVVRALLDEGVEVRALVREGSSWKRSLGGLDLETVTGDVTDRASVERALAGVDAVFHLAARYALHQRDAERTLAVNVGGTRTVMEAALAAGVERVVHTSSVAAIGHAGPAGEPADESVWADPRELAGPYERSKYESERLVQRLVAREGLPAVVVNPTAPIGPLDFKPTPTGQMVVDAANGAMPGYVASAGLNIADVRDVAAGHVLAWRRGVVGERYILGHREGNLSLQDVLGCAAEAAGRRGPRLRIPWTVAYAYAWLDERVLSRRRGDVVHAPLAGVRLARQRMWFACGRAVEDLEMPQRPLAESFGDAVSFFASVGMVKRSGL